MSITYKHKLTFILFSQSEARLHVLCYVFVYVYREVYHHTREGILCL